jgi:hypothetical protein
MLSDQSKILAYALFIVYVAPPFIVSPAAAAISTILAIATYPSLVIATLTYGIILADGKVSV